MVNTIQFTNLQVDIEHQDSMLLLRFSGDVDENFDQNKLPSTDDMHVIFELAGIKNFNSCGIREWIYLINRLDRAASVVFRQCSIAVIDQFNLIPDSVGTGTIESFYAPYYCSSCKLESAQKIDTKLHYHDIKAGKAPEMNCETCKNPLVFDALEESYFLFVTDGKEKAS